MGKGFTNLSKSKRVIIFSGIAVVLLIICTAVFEYGVVKESGRLTGDVSGALTISFIVLILCVLLVTAANLKATREREKEIAQRLTVADTLINCITVLAEENDINNAINNLLKILSDYFEGDRAYLFEFDYEKQTTSNSYEYAAEGVSAQIDNLQDVPLEVIDSWIKKFKETGTFYISSLDKDVDKTSDAYRILEMQEIDSLIAVPLIKDEGIIGFLGIDNPKSNYNDLSLLSSATFFILDSIDRRESHSMLQRLSFEDTLTGVFNRNKFNHTIEELRGKALNKIGVAYFDMNGLKEVNDTQGHEAGDRFIKNTAKGIKSVFNGEAYRIGGDEFVVIKQQVDENEFYSLIQKTEDSLAEVNVSVSVGVSWKEFTNDIEAQLSEADSLMYEKKGLFYNK